MVEAGGWPHQAKLGYLNARDPQNAKRGIIVKDPGPLRADAGAASS